MVCSGWKPTGDEKLKDGSGDDGQFFLEVM